MLPQDIRYTLRMMRKNPGLTAVIVLSLAIGIGANSAIFSVVDALLLRPLPYPESGRLAAVWLHSPAIGIFRDWPSPGEYVDVQRENHSFDEMAISQARSMILIGVEKPEPVSVVRTSSTLLQMLGRSRCWAAYCCPQRTYPANQWWPFWRMDRGSGCSRAIHTLSERASGWTAPCLKWRG